MPSQTAVKTVVTKTALWLSPRKLSMLTTKGCSQISMPLTMSN